MDSNDGLPAVAIPTYKRHSLVAKRTLKFLKDSEYPREKITLFVASEEEAELYRQIDPNLYGSVVVGELGLKEQRNFISRYYRNGDIIIQMDDDVKKVTMTRPFKEYVRQAMDRMAGEGAGLYGVMPKDDTRCYKDSYTTHLSHILGSFFMCINNSDIVITHSEKEDYERSILYFIRYGKVIRDRSCGVSTSYRKNPGGLQESDRTENMRKGAENLSQKYPDYCKAITKRGMPDVCLNWRATNKIASSEFAEIIKALEDRPLDVNKYRLNVGIGRSQCFGIVGKRSMPPDVSRQSWRNPHLHHLLMLFAAKYIKIPFTSIQINQDMKCAPHKDKGNIGLSAIVAFGNYSGGDLIVEGKRHDINRKILLFDGSKEEHYTDDFTGTRYSLVFHTIAPQEKWGNRVPAITDYEPVIHSGRWKLRRISDGKMFWGLKHGLPHFLKGYIR